MLLKYKQNCEYFQKNKLNEIIAKGLNKKQGEKALAIHLHEYIFNSGIEFIIEPSSQSGEVDLILKDSEGRYVIIEAKYLSDSLNKSQIRSKLASGFHQVMKYCHDYNESEGFLISFVNTKTRISYELDEIGGFNFLKIGDKIIYPYLKEKKSLKKKIE